MKKINRKAFTLIELLTVIVILVLIMGIATFAIVSVVDSSKKSTAELSAKTYISTINKLIVNNLLTSNKLLDGTYLVNNEGNLERNSNEYYIDITHDKPNNGLLVINTSKVESATLIINGYKIVYSNGAYITDNKENETYEEVESVFLKNAMVGTLSNYQIYGNSTQNGDPSPTSPATITSLGESGSIEVVSGKNLLNQSEFEIGGISGSGVPFISTERFRMANYIEIKPSTQYIFTFPNGYKSINYHQYDSNYNWISVLSASSGSTTASNAKYIKASFATTFGDTITTELLTTIKKLHWQLEQGSTPTSYEPYAASSVTIVLTGHEPLRKIGDIADYIDYKSGKIIRNIGKYVVTGQEEWFQNSTNYAITVPNITGNIAMCSHYPYTSGTTNNAIKVLSSTLRFYTVTDYSALNSWKSFLNGQYLAGTPVTIYYQLAPPDDTEKIALPKISITSPNSYIKVPGASKVVINN